MSLPIPRIVSRLVHAVLAICIGAGGLAAADGAAAIEVEPKARLHLDYGAYDADAQPLDDNLIARRATLGLEGKFNDSWDFEIAYEFAHDGDIKPRDGHFRDVSVTYEGWTAGDITAGQFKLPFGLEELTSSNNLTFIERALPVDAFAPSRRMGAGFARLRDNYTFTTMAFGSSLDGDDRGRGVAARFTVAPVHTAATVVHFGVAAVTETPKSKVDFDTTPEARPADVDLVNTGRIQDVTRINRVGLESAWRTGPWSLQAEWMQANVRRNAGQPNASLDGWYVVGSWVLTGESRPYKHGEFKGIKPAGRGGAWELTARYSHIDLDAAGVRGGKESNLALGVNYYLNQHVRTMLNYIRVHSQRRSVVDDPNILLLRAQFAW